MIFDFWLFLFLFFKFLTIYPQFIIGRVSQIICLSLLSHCEQLQGNFLAPLQMTAAIVSWKNKRYKYFLCGERCIFIIFTLSLFQKTFFGRLHWPCFVLWCTLACTKVGLQSLLQVKSIIELYMTAIRPFTSRNNPMWQIHLES